MKHVIFTVFFLLLVTLTTVSAQVSPLKISYESGVALAHSQAYEDALKKFDIALGLADGKTVSDAMLARIHFNTGVCLYQLHRHAEAVEAFGRAVNYAPRYEKAYYALGMARAETGNWNEAESAFQSAIGIDPKNGETWFDLAFVYLAQKNLGAARAAFERSTKYKSVDSAIGHNNIGVILAMNGDFAKAAAEFRRAIFESSGKLDVARSNLEFCRQHVGKTEGDVAKSLEFGRAKRAFGE